MPFPWSMSDGDFSSTADRCGATFSTVAFQLRFLRANRLCPKSDEASELGIEPHDSLTPIICDIGLDLGRRKQRIFGVIHPVDLFHPGAGRR
jgi:hypothetical protein